MNSIGRKQYLLKKLQIDGSISITDLAEELNVSSMTIRRDLKALSENGLVTLGHGGAVLNNGSLFEFNTAIKQEIKADEKLRIAQKCLEFVNEGDSIYLDAGTTVSKIAGLLSRQKNIIILTHSLLVANKTANFKNVKVIMCPGELRRDSMAYMGPLTDEFIKQFRIDTLFLGVEGIDLVNGVSVPDIVDGVTKKNLISNARKVVCVADSSKFNSSLFYRIAPLTEIDVIITDADLDEETLSQYLQHDIQVITV